MVHKSFIETEVLWFGHWTLETHPRPLPFTVFPEPSSAYAQLALDRKIRSGESSAPSSQYHAPFFFFLRIPWIRKLRSPTSDVDAVVIFSVTEESSCLSDEPRVPPITSGLEPSSFSGEWFHLQFVRELCVSFLGKMRSSRADSVKKNSSVSQWRPDVNSLRLLSASVGPTCVARRHTSISFFALLFHPRLTV